MADICDMILEEHEQQRRGFAALDRLGSAEAEVVGGAWEPLARLLERHAAAEEAVFYPALLRHGTAAEEETTDAISDHNDIRDAVRRAGAEEPGTSGWWDAVKAAREANSQHMAEEERGALADLRANDGAGDREELAAQWLAYVGAYAAGDIPDRDRDPQAYVESRKGR